MPIVADSYDLVVGVDTHAASHTVALIRCPTGAELAQARFPTSRAGLGRLAGWITRRAGDAAVLVVIEGAGSYGAVLCRRLQAAGWPVAEAPRLGAAQFRGVGKTDALDAARIGRAVLGLEVERLRIPRATGVREALRVLVVAREEMTAEKTRATNALTALVRTVDLGVDARRPLSLGQVRVIAAWRTRIEPLEIAIARAEAIRLARRVLALTEELRDNEALLVALVTEHAPALLRLTGVGPVVAATVLVAWSHPGRVRSEAALAALAGTCPIPASSGNTVRHRLNRGGDRRLNRAIATIAMVRTRMDPDTRAYVARRTTEGRTKKEIKRALKRYITRQLFRTLQAQPPTSLARAA
jgi:transposase